MRKDCDFTGAKRAKDVRHLARLQAEAARGKSRITIFIDDEQQQKAPDSFEAEPLQVVATTSECEAVCEIDEDEKRQSAIRAVAFRTVARRLADDL